MIGIKVDPRMKKALEKLAQEEFTSVSGIIKKATSLYLAEQGIDWKATQIREEVAEYKPDVPVGPPSKKPKKPKKKK